MQPRRRPRSRGFSRDVVSRRCGTWSWPDSASRLMPELAVESPFGSQRGLAVREFGKPAPTRTVGAVWRKSSTRARRHRGRLRRHGGVMAAQGLTGLMAQSLTRKPAAAGASVRRRRGLGISRRPTQPCSRRWRAGATATACANSSVRRRSRSSRLSRVPPGRVKTSRRTARARDRPGHDGIEAVR